MTRLQYEVDIIAYYYYIHLFFFFNDTATTEIYTLSLHDALPIWSKTWEIPTNFPIVLRVMQFSCYLEDRKSTRLNSSHVKISYAVFCLKKKNNVEDSNNLYVILQHVNELSLHMTTVLSF